MSGPLRRAGRLIDETGFETSWSVAEGRRGRRWRWSVVDRRGSFVAAHTLELDPDGRFVRLESAAASGLLSLHREADGSIHGNRVAERGVDHLEISMAPELVIVGGGQIGLAALIPGVGSAGTDGRMDVVEVLDDLGVRVTEGAIRRLSEGEWELRVGRAARRVRLDDLGLPSDDGPLITSWPLERD